MKFIVFAMRSMKISKTWKNDVCMFFLHFFYRNELWNPMYNFNLKEHGERHSKEKGQNSPKWAPEGPAIFKTWIVRFGLIDHLLVQRVEEHLKIIARYKTVKPPWHWEGFLWALAAHFQILQEEPLTRQHLLRHWLPLKCPLRILKMLIISGGTQIRWCFFWYHHNLQW